MNRNKVILPRKSGSNVKTIQSVLLNEDDDTETFYLNAMNQFKTIIIDQKNELHDKDHKLQVVERAFKIKKDEENKFVKSNEDELNEIKLKLKLAEQELEFHRGKETNKNGTKGEVRKIIRELQEIHTKKRNNLLDESLLDEEARAYLDKYK